MCGRNKSSGIGQRNDTIIYPNQYPKITTRPTILTKETCKIPEQPENGDWMLEKNLCPEKKECHVHPGINELDPGTQLIYNCKSGYKINGTKDVFCGLRGKWSAIPRCVEIKCPALSSASTEAKCTLESGWLSCDNPVPIKTIAELSCRNSYVPDSTDLTRRDTVKCNNKGEWEPSPIKCVSGKCVKTEFLLTIHFGTIFFF